MITTTTWATQLSIVAKIASEWAATVHDGLRVRGDWADPAIVKRCVMELRDRLNRLEYQSRDAGEDVPL